MNDECGATERRSDAGRRAWQNRIAQKSVDFLLCDPQTLRPIVAVELDDATHAGEKRRQRDADVDRLLSAAGLPLVRFPARRTYDLGEISAGIGPHLAR